jgi:uncharacterized protein (TIRG00374 family)
MYHKTARINAGSFVEYNLSVRKFLLAITLLFGVLFIIGRFTEMQGILSVLENSRIEFIFLALLVLIVWIGVVGITYKSIYQALGMPVGVWYMTRVAIAANFINVVAPAGGLSSVALFISTAKGDGRSTARATVASVLFVWLEYGATLVMLTFGLGEMARRNNLHWAEITASLILLAGALGLGVLLYLGAISSTLLGKVLASAARVVNFVVHPFIRREYLSSERAFSFATELSEGAAALHGKPSLLIKPLLLAMTNKLLLILILGLSFLAFEIEFNPGVLVASFSIAYLFLIVSPTPAGIGIVEGILTVSLGSLGVPLSSAAVITLAYRGITFWVPLLVGMVAIRTLKQ